MNIKLVFRRMIYSDGMNPLKHSVIFVITFFFFISTMTTTSVFSYLPKLVKSFGASEVQAGKDAGLIGSSLFFSRIFSSLLWGYFADKCGKKKLLLISSICIAISTLAFAFTRSFTWALVTKLLQGAAMGVIVITKSIMVDVCDDTNVSLAFSILFTGYHLGNIIGTSLSAVLVFPAEQYPKAFSKGVKYEIQQQQTFLTLFQFDYLAKVRFRKYRKRFWISCRLFNPGIKVLCQLGVMRKSILFISFFC
ncbi:uncharacterized protein LOC136089513 [Hydra vulgaris]|uniref:Uncharacterized protein LOC136089513 n=1 Tax=Hydra vulgaris TaxID=6087 RepID=A0ABM4DB91_HYDVU